ncbi:hypothetical protein PybrP1_008060, partial [[Pythium] brassicae (nom. inval.)]
KLRVHPRIRSGREFPNHNNSDDKRNSSRAIAWLQFVTPQSLGAMLYFATLKFAAGVLSCVVACGAKSRDNGSTTPASFV